MSRNIFGEHGIDPETVDEDDAPFQNDVWAYDGELDLSVEDEYEPGPVGNGFDYISKSRIKTFLKCPRKFGYKYLAEEREDENFYMKRGSIIHETFEEFHRELGDFVEQHGRAPNRLTDLIDSMEAEGWFQFIEYLTPFFEWELERLAEARENTDSLTEAVETWVPHSVEKEMFVDDPPVGTIQWHGPYDALLDAASVPEVNENDGYVVVDYKTGSLPDRQYRDTGIHIDLSFYAWMLEWAKNLDIVAGIGFYPSEDGNIVVEVPNEEARQNIKEVVEFFHVADPTKEDFPINENPLCDWCHFQEQCPSGW